MNSSLSYSTDHTILVWTLNFYVIETTSKFVPDCNLSANTIVTAINVLKRTTNLTLFSCIIHVSSFLNNNENALVVSINLYFFKLISGIGKGNNFQSN